MLPGGECQVVLRKLVEQFDVARQADTHVSAFDQIMAQQQLFGESAGEHPAERPRIVDALAMVRTFAGKILVDV